MANKLTLQTIFTALDRVSGPSKTMAKNVGKSTSAMDGAFRKLGGAIAAVGIISFGKKALDLASDLTEVQNVVDTSFGKDGSKIINDWSTRAIKAFGLSELQAKKFNGTMGAMLKSSGLTGGKLVEVSTNLAGLAGDFASFYNLDAEEAFDKIRAGISGETEPLKQLGINMSVANLQAFALTKGLRKKWEKMSQGEQIQLRYAYLMQASADAQGDFAKTLATSYANQKRVLKTQIEQNAARAMSAVLPHAIRLATALNGVVERIGSWVEANQGIISQRVDQVFKAIGVAVDLFAKAWDSGLIEGLALGLALLKSASIAMAVFNAVMSANPAGLIAVGIVALVAGIVMLVKNWDKVKDAVASAWQTFLGFTDYIKTNALQIFIALGQTINKAWLTPINLVIDAIVGLLRVASKIPGIGGGFKAAADAVSGIQDRVNSALTGSAGTFDYGGTWANMPVSSNTTVTNRSQLDVNFNSLPAGTATRQTGSAPGITVNTGRQMGGRNVQ